MTDLEKKILSNAKPRIAEYEALFAEKSFEAGTVLIPIASFDGIIDQLVYDTRLRRVVAVNYPAQTKSSVKWKTAHTANVNWDEIPDMDPASMGASWDYE